MVPEHCAFLRGRVEKAFGYWGGDFLEAYCCEGEDSVGGAIAGEVGVGRKVPEFSRKFLVGHFVGCFLLSGYLPEVPRQWASPPWS